MVLPTPNDDEGDDDRDGRTRCLGRAVAWIVAPNVGACQMGAFVCNEHGYR